MITVRHPLAGRIDGSVIVETGSACRARLLRKCLRVQVVSNRSREELEDSGISCWLVDEAVLELLAATDSWKTWATNPRRPPSGAGHPSEIFGPTGLQFMEPYVSREAMREALMANHGGGVPVPVIEALIDAASEAGKRAQAVAQVVDTIATLEQSLGHQVSRKPLREAIWFWWNVPCFEKVPKVRSKYPLTLKWSPAAWLSHSDSTVSLVIEHVVPLGIIIQRLIDASGDETRIRSTLNEIEFVVITKAEDAQITQAGWRTTAPAKGDRYQRYRDAGLPLEEFVVPNDLIARANGEALS